MNIRLCRLCTLFTLLSPLLANRISCSQDLLAPTSRRGWNSWNTFVCEGVTRSYEPKPMPWSRATPTGRQRSCQHQCEDPEMLTNTGSLRLIRIGSDSGSADKYAELLAL